MTRGWRNESHRHSLSAKGIKTNRRYNFVSNGVSSSVVSSKREIVVGNHRIVENTFTVEDSVLVVWEDSPFAGGRDSVYRLFVDEGVRRRGVGTRLMRMAVSEYPNLSGQASNMGSIMFNYRLGFRPTNNPSASLEETIRLFRESPESLNITHVSEVTSDD